MISIIPFLSALLLYTAPQTDPRPLLLDDFSTLGGWKTIVSDGAKLALLSEPGIPGGCMVMEFDLTGGAGYVIAEKSFPIDLPEDYQFTFDLRGDTPVNNFEFKVIDEYENVHWIKKLNITYPESWTKQRIKKRHLSYAWGPAPGKPLKHVRALQFVVSAGTGGKGKVWIDNFRFEPRDVNSTTAAASISHGNGSIDTSGSVVTLWTSTPTPDSLVVDFQRVKEFGGLVVDWDSAGFANAYDVQVSDDGLDWSSVYTVRRGKPGRAYVPCGEVDGRYVKLVVREVAGSPRAIMRRMEFKDPSFSSSPNNVYREVARENPPGLFPKYFLDQQSYWTILGANGDAKEALMNQQGQIEVDRLRFSLEPFIYTDGRLVTWSQVQTRPSLRDHYLPMPAVTWTFGNDWTLMVEAVAAGVRGKSQLGVRYTLECRRERLRGKLFVAIRPFQVNPPWQALNIEGGTARIGNIDYRQGTVVVDGTAIVPVTMPSGFGAMEFDQGDITGYLVSGMLPPAQNVQDHYGHASAALSYDFDLKAGQSEKVILVVPFHEETPHQPVDFDHWMEETAREWEAKLGVVEISLPPAAQPVAHTVKSNLAYVLINRDGPGIQPGSRSYERSWIRDGSLTCAALLRLGLTDEVREFVDWYARGQFPNGKIPCVIDARGSDPVPEHDSHGQFIYAVRQYFLFSRDTAWLREKFHAVHSAVTYIQSLRAERKTEVYRLGTAEQRACYGLVPESISHEGYSDTPRHSYWDCFFVLRGLKDAAAIAEALGESALARDFAAERDDFQSALYASMRLAIQTKNITYIPGCVELGDFDATSTTVGLMPAGELGSIPEPELHNTFEQYYSFFQQRRSGANFVNYTPYEARVIGSFVLLGQKERAAEVLQFLLDDRRPPEWNHWAEVVWQDPLTPRFIGDMPHTWVGSDFIRSVLAMFLYDRDRDSAHVMCAGIPDAWVLDPAGVSVKRLATYHGSISYTLKRTGKRVVAEVSGTFDAPRHKLVLVSPLSGSVRSVKIDGRRKPVPANREVVLTSLPARVEFEY